MKAVAVLALLAAAPAPARERVALVTALPLMWGEGGPADVLAGRSERAAVLRELEADYRVEPVEVVSEEALGRGMAIVAQPRLLAPVELVALDAWVRKGGRLLVFADPRLDWRGKLPAGDPRAPPPVTLLDPLLSRWGLVLDEGENGVGRWRMSEACERVTPETADCAIGRGRALLVADADLLMRPGASDEVRSGLMRLQGKQRWSRAPIIAAGVVGLLIVALALRRREPKENKP